MHSQGGVWIAKKNAKTMNASALLNCEKERKRRNNAKSG